MRAHVAALVLLSACASPAGPPPPASKPPLATDYAAHSHPAADPWVCHQAVPDERVTEIAIERPTEHWYRVIGHSKRPVFDFGPGAAYTLTLRADGSVTYIGRANVPHLGTRQGVIAPAVFAKLAALVRESGFESMPDQYPCPWQDGSSVFVSCVIDGKRKTIFHGQPDVAGPAVLEALEVMIDRAGENTVWR